MHGRFCKTARARQLGRPRRAKSRDTRPKNTDCSSFSRTVPGSGCFSVGLRMSVHLFLSSYHPCSLLAPARSCSLQVASRPSAHMSSSISIAR